MTQWIIAGIEKISIPAMRCDVIGYLNHAQYWCVILKWWPSPGQGFFIVLHFRLLYQIVNQAYDCSLYLNNFTAYSSAPWSSHSVFCWTAHCWLEWHRLQHHHCKKTTSCRTFTHVYIMNVRYIKSAFLEATSNTNSWSFLQPYAGRPSGSVICFKYKVVTYTA